MARQAVQMVQALPAQQRRKRLPKHRFNIQNRPWAITPCMIAPVLPGETLENALFQARVVTDPIDDKLIGWYCEYYLFYVKHRDLDARDTLVDMHLQGASIAALNSGALVDTYHYADSVDWVSLCLKRVTEEYFRNEGEAWNAHMIGNLPAASILQDSMWDSITEDTTPAAANPLQDPEDMTVLSAYQEHYAQMVAMRMTDMSFEDYLKTFGVKGVRENEDLHKPELLRYVRDWSYPTNHVEPTTGVPTSAVSWAIAERADKSRFFKEPGFLFAVTVCRPKVYLKNQRGAGVHMLDSAAAWLPAILRQDPYTSLKHYDATAAIAGPLGVATDGYWIDVRDLYMYGDQFVNYAIANVPNGVALPTAALQRRYATATEADALFAGTDKAIRQDGVFSLQIMGALQDYT